ncbi:MAG TPA: DNA polymerase Y family protein [Rubrivivax sp.]|nr:DNA polymerase Y family protein [Rubrivivax sp.]
MLWIALYLPALSLDAFAAAFGAAGDALPLALLDGHRVAAVNAVAQRLGVEPGCRRATALALAPQLHFGRADAARDAQALRAVAHVALAFTPMVAIDAGAGRPCVLLEVQGSLRCFGGLERLQQRLLEAVAALEPLRLQHRLAAAPTAAGAALLARWRDGLALGAHATDQPALRALLDGAPLALLAQAVDGSAAVAPQGGGLGIRGPGGASGISGSVEAATERLQGMGLQCVGDLRSLPRAGLARRLGPALLLALDRARGDAPDPRDPLRPEARFAAACELHERADRSDQLLAAAALLLARLVAWAQAQHARIGSFTLRLRHERRHRSDAGEAEHTEVAVALAEPSNDPRHLQLLLRERLARLQLPAPTLQLQLRCGRLQHGPAPNGELFPTPADAREGLARLVVRLQARLGPEHVCRPVPVADHRPERAAVWQPAIWQPAGTAARQPASGPALRRQAQRSARRAGAVPAAAPAVAVRAAAVPAAAAPAAAAPAAPAAAAPAAPAAAVPAAAPAAAAPIRPVWLLEPPQPLPERRSQPWLDGAPLQLLAGPERIESGWWDGAPAQRDYFIARVADGVLVWVYRARLPTGNPAADGWFLHGRFG